MFWSEYFIPTMKETPVGTEAISHQLLLRAGLVNMLTSGVYSYLPLGLRVLSRIEKIIRDEMNTIGAHELLMPCLQPLDLWKQTGRDDTMKEIMIHFSDGKGRKMCLGPTHEEVITDLVKHYVQSYRQLPVMLYQIQTKFRDELRPRFGIVRACEFVMKDAYSFDRDIEGLKRNYQLMFEAYQKIFRRCGLEVIIVEADSGAMGGDVSHEFLVKAAIGEDEIVECSHCDFTGPVNDTQDEGKTCPKCQGFLKKHVAIELGHIFQLGTKYSEAQEGMFLDEDGQQKPIIMGCYGIGVSRLIAAIIETHNDKSGIIWPREISPFDVQILPVQPDEGEIKELSEKYYSDLKTAGYDILIDDRDESAGKKFADADLIGIPFRLVLGKRALRDGQVEIKMRDSGETRLVAKEDAFKVLEKLLSTQN